MAQKDKLIPTLDEVVHILKAKATKKAKADELHQSPFLRNADDTVNDTALEYVLSRIENVKEGIMKIQEAKPKQGGDSSKKKIQLYIPAQTAITKKIETEVTKLMKDIGCTVCYKISDLYEDMPVFVLCQVVSRCESDISAALNGFKWSKKYVALVVFVKREEHLPQIETGVHLDTNELPYGDVEFIDTAFTTEELFYKTRMNTLAQQKIKQFVDKFNK